MKNNQNVCSRRQIANSNIPHIVHVWLLDVGAMSLKPQWGDVGAMSLKPQWGDKVTFYTFLLFCHILEQW